MQHIGLNTINERGEILNRSDINFAIVMNVLFEEDDYKKYDWLSTIEPYGLTVLNKLQIPKLLEDINKLANVYPQLKDIAEEITNYAMKVEDLQYLEFVGD